jgi:hypothetical protein
MLRVVQVTGSTSVASALDTAVVTAADMVAGHVRLDISCLDRLYLNGFVAKLQTAGGVVYFLHDHRGKPIASPALFEPIGEKFRREIKDWAQASAIPVIRFKAGERKADVMSPYLQAAAAAGRSQVVAIGCARSSSMCGRRVSATPIRACARSFPPPGNSGGCRCFTSTSSMSGWGRGSSRSAPTSPIRSRCG